MSQDFPKLYSQTKIWCSKGLVRTRPILMRVILGYERIIVEKDIQSINALGDATRRKLFERIRQGSCSVSELVTTVSVSQPAVSQHLKVLREAQLVSVMKKGQQRIYHLNPKGLQELRSYVENLWEDALHAFGEEAEKMARAQGNPK